MRRHWAAALLLAMAVTACDGTEGGGSAPAAGSPPPSPPPSLSPSLSPSPAPDAERLAVCRRALDLAATAVRLVNENIAVPVQQIETKRIDAATDDMRAVQKRLPPVLSSQYDGLTAPLLLIRLAAVNDTRASLAGQDLRSTVLLFAAGCDSWTREP